MSRTWGRTLLASAVTLALGACGGGGGDSDEPATEIGGRLQVAEGTYADAPDGERMLSNPATVSGSATVGGGSDRYRVTLAQGQAVSLVAAAGQTLRLRLCAVGGDCEQTRATAGQPVRTLLAPADDTYRVELVAEAGSGLYVLGVAGGASTADFAAAAGPFVAGEILVGLRAGAQWPDGALSRQVAPGSDEGPVLVHLDTPAGETTLSRFGVSGVDSDGLRARTLRAVAELRRHPDVRYAEPNYLWERDRIPNDPRYATQWHYPALALPEAWDEVIGSGSDVTVAVVDDGIRRHVDLNGRLLFDQGYDFASDPNFSNDGDGIDPDPTDPAVDGIFHGTEVSGLVAAATNNGLGVAGSAWQAARVLPVRVGSASRITLADVLNGVRYAAGLATPAGPALAAPRAQVVNLSLGGPGGAAQAAEFARVRERGVIVLAAAGNTGDATPQYPAAHATVLGVAATRRDGTRAPYSTMGASVSFAAPGGDAGDPVQTLTGDDAYAGVGGTSFAAPQAAGVVALMKAVHPDLTPEAVECGVRAGELTDGEPDAWDPALGYGRLDAAAAVDYAGRLARGESMVSPRVDAVPRQLDFGSLTQRMAIEFRIICGDGAFAGPPEPQAAWLTVTALDAAGGRYRASVNRSGLAEGVNRTVLRVETDGGQRLDVPVTVLVEPVPAADAGRQYVQLYRWADYVDGEPASRQLELDGSDDYRYRFTDVAPGEYAVIASSDLDGDRRLCQLAEICGGWPDGGTVEPLEIDEGEVREDVNFPVAPLTFLAPQQRKEGP